MNNSIAEMPPKKPCPVATNFEQTYLKRMSEIYCELDDEPPRIPPCTTQDVEKLKEIIKQGDPRNEIFLQAKNFYGVIVKDGEEIVIIKSQSRTVGEAPIIQVIGYEEAFYKMYKIHVPKHCHRKYVGEGIKSKYLIPRRCIAEFCRLCPTCEERRKKHTSVRCKKPKKTLPPKSSLDTVMSQRHTKETSYAKIAMEQPDKNKNNAHKPSEQCNASSIRKKPPSFNTEIYLTVLHQIPPDNDFNYILVYCDRTTNFSILRPLMKLLPRDIAIELVKIFSDYGPPLHFIVYKLGTGVIKLVLDEVNKVWPFSMDAFSFANTQDYVLWRVRSHLNRWIKETSSNSWSIGIHIVQWRLNTTLTTTNSHFYKKKLTKQINNNKERAVTVISEEEPAQKMQKQENMATLTPLSNKLSTSKTIGNDADSQFIWVPVHEESIALETPSTSDIMHSSTKSGDLHIKEETGTELNTSLITSSDIERPIKTEEGEFELKIENCESYFDCKTEPEKEDQTEATTVDVKLETDMSSYILPHSAPQMENEDGTGPFPSTDLNTSTLNPMIITPTLKIPGGALLRPVLHAGSNLTENTQINPLCSYSDMS